MLFLDDSAIFHTLDGSTAFLSWSATKSALKGREMKVDPDKLGMENVASGQSF